MTFPIVQTADTQTGTVTSNTGTFTLTYPTNIASGDLLLAFIAQDGTGGTVTWPAGWVKDTLNGNLNACSLQYAKKSADGTETGDFNVTITTNEQCAWRVFRITGWEGTLGTTYSTASSTDGSIESFEATNASNANPDPELLNPTWATEDTLWMAVITVDFSRTISVFPSNMPDLQTADVSGGSNGATLGIAMASSTVASFDPAAFTISNADDWGAITVGVRPGAVVASVPYLVMARQGPA